MSRRQLKPRRGSIESINDGFDKLRRKFGSAAVDRVKHGPIAAAPVFATTSHQHAPAPKTVAQRLLDKARRLGISAKGLLRQHEMSRTSQMALELRPGRGFTSADKTAYQVTINGNLVRPGHLRGAGKISKRRRSEARRAAARGSKHGDREPGPNYRKACERTVQRAVSARRLEAELDRQELRRLSREIGKEAAIAKLRRRSEQQQKG